MVESFFSCFWGVIFLILVVGNIVACLVATTLLIIENYKEKKKQREWDERFTKQQKNDPWNPYNPKF
jgi:hypothetical protein